MSENGRSGSAPSSPGSSGASSTPSSPAPGTPPNLHQNTLDPDTKWLVQKFGGTSVGKFAIKIAEEIVPSVFFLFFNLKVEVQDHLTA